MFEVVPSPSDRFSIDCITPFEAREIMAGIKGAAWSKQRRRWTIPLTPFSCWNVAEKAEELDKFGVRIDERIIDIYDRARRAVVPDDSPPPVTNDERPPWKPQCEAFNRVAKFWKICPSGVGLDMAMGTGKSKVVVDLHQSTFEEIWPDRPGRPFRHLIVCPKSVINVWANQYLEHWAYEDETLQMIFVGPQVRPQLVRTAPSWWSWSKSWKGVGRRTNELKGALLQRRHNQVVVVAVEAWWREPLGSFLRAIEWDQITVDEIHRAKNATATTTKNLVKMMRTAPRRVGLSGTMMPNNAEDAFGVSKTLDVGCFGTRLGDYREKYLHMHPKIPNAVTFNRSTGNWFKSPEAEKDFEERWGLLTYHSGKDLDRLPALLPPLDRYTTLEPEAAQAYADLETQKIALVEELIENNPGADRATILKKVVETPNAMTLVSKLQQLVGGFLLAEDGERIRISKAKEELLEEILGDLPFDERVVVFARYRHELDVIKAVAGRLKRPFGEVSGRRKDIEAKWFPESPIRIAGVQTQSGSVGVDYTLACYSFFYSVWGLGDYLQARDRTHRPGQTRPVTIGHLLTEGNAEGGLVVDEQILRSCQRKENALSKIYQRAVEAAFEKHGK